MRLQRQLRNAGASKQQAAELARMARNVSKIKTSGLSARTQQEILSVIDEKEVPKNRKPLFWAISSTATAVCAVVIIVTSLRPPTQSKPMTQQDGDSGSSETLPAEQLEYLDNLSKQRKAELKELDEKEAELAKVQEIEQKYENAFEEFWSRYHRPDDKRRNKLWQRLFNSDKNNAVTKDL